MFYKESIRFCLLTRFFSLSYSPTLRYNLLKGNQKLVKILYRVYLGFNLV